MLTAFKGKSSFIDKVSRDGNALYLHSESGTCRLIFKTDNIVRTSFAPKGQFVEAPTPGMSNDLVYSKWEYEEKNDSVVVFTDKLKLVVDKKSMATDYYDGQGNLLLKETGWELEEFTTYKILEDSDVETEMVNTADGVKQVIKSANRVESDKMYHARLRMEWSEDEALYGLGQQEEGVLNLRGQTVYVHQANRKIAMPVLLSNKGYGILMDTYSALVFNDNVYGHYLYTEAVKELDYYFIWGEGMDGVVAGYRKLSGKASMLPRWAFGYMQSQERYETQQEILEVAKKHRDKGIGLDTIILDWMSWEDGKWGQKSFDASRFPEPLRMTEALHDMDVHFMISIWPNMDPSCENHKEFKENKLFCPQSTLYNCLDENARKLYWSQVERALYVNGVDAWWCDSSEAITPEWNCNGRMEAANLYAEFNKALSDIVPADMTNAYCLFHARTMYEGQRNSELKQFSEKRVINLTRSGYTGQQRFGTILWSGDTAASWDTLRRQVATGLNFCASGLPYWTTDIGAFFVKKGFQWYWDGEYEDTVDDLGYRELFVRWYQWGCFLPVFRGHGTDCRREIWNFGDEGDMFYESLKKFNKLRYSLMPYIYSKAGHVWLDDDSMIKMLAFLFPNDKTAINISTQYMFGDSIMVCPVLKPMYYEKESVKLTCDADKACGKTDENMIHVSKTIDVYLPAGVDWYDFWTGEKFKGGQWIKASACIDEMPLFVKAGSIIPMGVAGTNVREAIEEVKFVIYPGRDVTYNYYEDAGDGYGYENGEYSVTTISWDETKQEVVASDGINVVIKH